MDEKRFALFMELMSGLPQQGPGDPDSTERALRMVEDLPARPEILDVGSGSGRQSLDLLRLTNGKITAVDLCKEYLEDFAAEARRAGYEDRITTLQHDMASLEFLPGRFDLVWAEGSAYNMGVDNALESWRCFLRPGGSLAFSELVRLTPHPPVEALEFWEGEYPAMRDEEGNVRAIEAHGYRLCGRFALPESSWWAYYGPVEKNLVGFRERYPDDEDARQVAARTELEIEQYRKHSTHYGYVLFVCRVT